MAAVQNISAPIISAAGLDDLIQWPDGTVCDREEVLRGGMSHMSDDYQVFAHGTVEWFELAKSEGLI